MRSINLRGMLRLPRRRKHSPSLSCTNRWAKQARPNHECSFSSGALSDKINRQPSSEPAPHVILPMSMLGCAIVLSLDPAPSIVGVGALTKYWRRHPIGSGPGSGLFSKEANKVMEPRWSWRSNFVPGPPGPQAHQRL